MPGIACMWHFLLITAECKWANAVDARDCKWECDIYLFISYLLKLLNVFREAQMKKEANVQRMAEKQKEAKLAVCAILLTAAGCCVFS